MDVQNFNVGSVGPYVAYGAAGALGAGAATAVLVGLRARGVTVSSAGSLGIIVSGAGIGAALGALCKALHNGNDSSQDPPVGGLTDSTVRVAQLNAYNLFDTVDDPSKQDDVATPKELQLHLDKLAHAIADDLGAPDVITTEEVENLDVLQQLANHPLLKQYGYKAVLLEGSDPRAIDVGVLYRDRSFKLDKVTQMNTMIPSGASGRLTKLFTRPPLVVELQRRTPSGAVDDAADGANNLTLIVNHWTSKLGGEDSEPRRLAQGQYLNQVAATRLGFVPDERLIVIGDLNAAEDDPPYQALFDTANGASLTDLAGGIPQDDRYSYIYRGERSMLDHAVGSPAAEQSLVGASMLHINTAATAADKRDPSTGRGVSDHDPLVIELADN
jgi:predicted extracellular nuclease